MSNARTILTRNHVLRAIHTCLEVFKPYIKATRFGLMDDKIIPSRA